MEAYQNKSQTSGVTAYEIGNDFIKIQFKGQNGVYLYNYDVPGAKDVEEMKKRAINGKGLNTFINQHVGSYYTKE